MSIIKVIKETFFYKYIAYRIHKYQVVRNPLNEINRYYNLIFGHDADLKKPKSLIEKIYWMQMHTDTSLWTLCSDKYRMRDYVKEKGLEKYLPKLYGHWENPNDIDFTALPSSFVIKANNGCATVKIVKDKTEIDPNVIKKELKRWLALPFGYSGYEPHYLKIKPCIIAEELLDGSTQPNKSQSLVDYKIWTFDGKPEFIVCYSNRHNKYYCEIGVYDRNWDAYPEYLRYSSHYIPEHKTMPKPNCLDDMFHVASLLSNGHPQMRVDLYEVNGRVYFGELTLTSSGGYMNHFTKTFLDKLGRLTVLPIDKK